eukprot:244518_1
MLGPLSNNNIPQPRNNHATTQPQMNRHVRNVVSPMPNNNLPSPMHRYKRLCSKSITQLAKRIARDMYETSHGGKLIRIPFAFQWISVINGEKHHQHTMQSVKDAEQCKYRQSKDTDHEEE